MFHRLIASATVVIAAAVASSLTLAAMPSHAQTAAKQVPDFTVFFDPPTGFVFVKLPAGWKFVGKAEPREGVAMAPGVVTSLLEPLDDTATEAVSRLARKP